MDANGIDAGSPFLAGDREQRDTWCVSLVGKAMHSRSPAEWLSHSLQEKKAWRRKG